MAIFALSPAAATGVVDWAPLLSQLYTRMHWVFHVPVGSATESPPFSEPFSLSALWGRLLVS